MLDGVTSLDCKCQEQGIAIVTLHDVMTALWQAHSIAGNALTIPGMRGAHCPVVQQLSTLRILTISKYGL